MTKKQYFSPRLLTIEAVPQGFLAGSFTDGTSYNGGVGHVDTTPGGGFGDAPAFEPKSLEE